MRGNVVLLCTGDRALGRLATAVLTCSGNRTLRIAEFLEAVAALDTGAADLAIVDVESFSGAMSFIRTAAERLPVVAIVDDEGEGVGAHLLAREGITNIVARRAPEDSEIDDYDELRITVEKILRNDAFGLEKYISGFGCEIQDIILRSAAQREDELAHIEKFLRHLGAPRRIARSILTAADEMITNAIYNAPRDTEGAPRYAATDRREKIALEPSEHVLLRYGASGSRIGLSVVDNFGGLELERLRECLRRCTEETEQIEQKAGGAGIGLFMLSRSTQQLVFNVDPGRCTEVIALWELGESRRASTRATRRSIHYFEASADTMRIETTADAISSLDAGDAPQLRLVGARRPRETARGTTSPTVPLEPADIPRDFAGEDTPTDMN